MDGFREMKLRLISADRWLAFWTMELICFLKRKSASTIIPRSVTESTMAMMLSSMLYECGCLIEPDIVETHIL